MPFRTVDELQVDPATAVVYEHGWQSWSPAGLYRVTATSPRPLHPRCSRLSRSLRRHR